MSFTRRGLLVGGLAAAASTLVPREAAAIGPSSKFRFGALTLSGRPHPGPRPNALKRLSWEISKRTTIQVEEPVLVTPTSETLHETPFIYLAGDREVELPSQAGIESLRRFLTFGGFLLIDSAEGSPDGAFDASVRKLIAAVFQKSPSSGDKIFEIVKDDHVVYKSFYLLDRPYGRLMVQPAMEAVIRDGRIVVAYLGNDLGGAWARDDFGNSAFPCEPGGERQRELAYRMGINLVMYAVCLDYKADQVHVPFIMKRRRWNPDDGAATPVLPKTKP